ncbi:MAG: aminodeoxychorismate/anthranilate synthase component II [Bacteroidota bacterium]
MQLLLLDNHDSFTWNLVELLRRTGKVNVNIFTQEQLNIRTLDQYDQIIFSPGPGLPQEHPAMFDMLRAVEHLKKKGLKAIPVFGVCLGMQALAVHFGGSLVNLPSVIHGQPRTITVLKPDSPLFTGVTGQFEAGLYHSWAVDPASFPACLDKLAVTRDGTIMALAHKTLPFCGVQFHPESIMTSMGRQLLSNWLNYTSSSLSNSF